jgi:hypothetical protein
MVFGACAGAACWAVSGRALATSARAISLSELLHRSRNALLATPTSTESRWETAYGSRRIVTYTRLVVDQTLDGRTLPGSNGSAANGSDSELLIRTLGGKVGHIGQLVHGEARLQLDKPNALFIELDDEQVWRVTAMAQGHYPLQLDAQGVRRLTRSPDLPQLKPDAQAAVQLLPGRTILEAERLLAEQ